MGQANKCYKYALFIQIILTYIMRISFLNETRRESAAVRQHLLLLYLRKVFEIMLFNKQVVLLKTATLHKHY